MTVSRNVCIDADVGDMDATAAAFARATYIAKLETAVQRVTGVPLEPRAAIGVYDLEHKALHASCRQRRRRTPEA